MATLLPASATHSPDMLAHAAASALRSACRAPAGANTALDLLAADALLTDACAAAASLGDAELAAFTQKLDAHHFQKLADE